MLNLFKVTGAARGTFSGLERPTYLLNLRVSDLAFTCILHTIGNIKYTSFNEKKLKNFQGGSLYLTTFSTPNLQIELRLSVHTVKILAMPLFIVSTVCEAA